MIHDPILDEGSCDFCDSEVVVVCLNQVGPFSDGVFICLRCVLEVFPKEGSA
jgi:hypothetical protein